MEPAAEKRKGTGDMKAPSAQKMVFCAVCAALTAALSQVQIPLPGLVPLSLATFGVMLSGLLLGWRWGAMAMAVYILMGAAGAPVFAGLKGGAAALLGPTGGYIVGYVPCAALAGLNAPRLQETRWGRCLLSVLGTLTCYALGTAWFTHATGRGLGESLALCVLPFLPGDGAKILLAAFLAPRLRRAVHL